MNSLEKAVYLATSNDLAAAAVSETQVGGSWAARRYGRGWGSAAGCQAGIAQRRQCLSHR